MASLFDRAVEASFKPNDGGYVFRCPSPWLFGSWRTYLVNEAQKASLAAHLRQRQRLLLWLMAIYLTIAFAATMLFQSGAPDTSTSGFLAVVVLTLLGMLALAVLPHLYLMRKIAPLLAQLPRADEQITVREQLFGVAAVISPLHLALGGLGGFLVAVANIKTIVEDLAQGGGGSELLWPVTGVVLGVLLASYFAYLTIVRRRLKRKPN
jgi:hypothetical protein